MKSKIYQMLKKNWLSILALSFILLITFSTEAKATFQRNLMKIGFFQPKFDNNLPSINTEENYDLNLIDLKGNKLSLNDTKGKVVFINFWATWCGPCIAEMPTIQILYDKFKNRNDVVFAIIEVEGNRKKTDSFIKKRKLNLPIYFAEGTIPHDLFDGILPSTVILDKQGKIAHRTLGAADFSDEEVVTFLNDLSKMKL